MISSRRLEDDHRIEACGFGDTEVNAEMPTAPMVCGISGTPLSEIAVGSTNERPATTALQRRRDEGGAVMDDDGEGRLTALGSVRVSPAAATYAGRSPRPVSPSGCSTTADDRAGDDTDERPLREGVIKHVTTLARGADEHCVGDRGGTAGQFQERVRGQNGPLSESCTGCLTERQQACCSIRGVSSRSDHRQSSIHSI